MEVRRFIAAFGTAYAAFKLTKLSSNACGSVHSELGQVPAIQKAAINRRTPSRGLAMLELILALPILLFIMALIINYGTVAAWKVREHSVARLAVWETRWPRTRLDRSPS